MAARYHTTDNRVKDDNWREYDLRQGVSPVDQAAAVAISQFPCRPREVAVRSCRLQQRQIDRSTAGCGGKVFQIICALLHCIVGRPKPPGDFRLRIAGRQLHHGIQPPTFVVGSERNAVQ